jgi:hypothetical protein
MGMALSGVLVSVRSEGEGKVRVSVTTNVFSSTTALLFNIYSFYTFHKSSTRVHIKRITMYKYSIGD